MKLRVLGCSGGIGARARTTSFLVDDDVLLDAGTGVEDLSVAELAAIDHVFLTHCHLDHICALPLLVDSAGALRERPITVHALPETIAALRAHIFNWVIWPDFTEIPHFDRPYMRFEPITVGASVAIDKPGHGHRMVKALPANHTVPALGYQLSTERSALVFSGDTSPNDDFWRIVNTVPNLRVLIIETAFANKERDLAVLAKHLFPVQLAQELAKLQREAKILITHLKPSDRELIEREIGAWAGKFGPELLEGGQVIEID